MTTEDPVETSGLLLKKPPIFYDAKIPFKHWQLRSLLCSATSDILYYLSNNRIYSLNTATRKRRLVAALPFSPRCIGARHGWVCAGGADRGHFASIRVQHDDLSSSLDIRNDAMALDGDENIGPRSTGGQFGVNVKELGGCIVNSVTLHRPPSSTSDDDVLAVLTNNDKTVRIFHLAENRVVTTLHVDVPTNHASISPNGQHLVVVGDSPEVYFYHPASSGSCNRFLGTGIGEAGCGSWILSSHPPLRAGTDTDALMSTSFSSSSLHCAVASQAGIITIFDTRYLSCDDGCSPLVKVLTSSRPFTEHGAVRSVQFSPAPWDLLVWAEHTGRVCVADARNNFTRRQVVDVLAERENFVEAEIEEVQGSLSAWDISQTLLGNPISSTPQRYSRDDHEDDGTVAVADAERNTSIELAELYENSREWLAARLGSTPSLLRDYHEQIERERVRQRIHDPPRRRNSIHPSYAGHSTPTSSNPSTSTAPTSAAAATVSGERGGGRLTPGATVALRPLEQITSMIVAEQRRTQRRTGRFDAAPFAIPVVSCNVVDITGCTLDPEGRKLFVATDKGVVEYGIDIHGRKLFPSMCPR